MQCIVRTQVHAFLGRQAHASYHAIAGNGCRYHVHASRDRNGRAVHWWAGNHDATAPAGDRYRSAATLAELDAILASLRA